jgi:hypothetical protein
MSQHAAPARRLPRKTLVAIIAASLVAVGGVAYALYILTAGVSGTVSSNSASMRWVRDIGNEPQATGTATTCNVGPLTTGAPVLSGIEVRGFPGDYCDITAKLSITGDGVFRVTGTAITGLPTGWTAMVIPDGGCGASIAESFTISQAPRVGVRITIGDGPGVSNVAIGGGLLVSPESQVGGGALTCNIQTGA